MLAQYPELFSEANAALIRARQAPIVDEVWTAINRTHQSFLDDTLIHHHINQGSIASGLPSRIHINWHGVLHPD